MALSNSGKERARLDWYMPPEWGRHSKMWMAWPSHAEWVSELGREHVEKAWAEAANAISTFEPVAMLVAPDAETRAKQRLSNDIECVPLDMVDAWMRDCGPTFVVSEACELAAIDWTFNGWGGRTWPEAALDALIAGRVADREGIPLIRSALVNEGGGIHVDGRGTVLLTETVQLNANRNPNWPKDEVEAEIHRLLGTTKAIWIKRGMESDYGPWGTDGHIDGAAAFIENGAVLYHHQPDTGHPDHAVSQGIRETLDRETNATDRPLEVVAIDAPRPYNTYQAEASYINFVYVNGGIVLGVYGDEERDQRAIAQFKELHPNRQVVPVRADVIYAAGGGVHCITQQQPLVKGE